MKTVSTKLENKDFDRLVQMCNDDGECISESLRGMIKQHLEAYEDGKEYEKEHSQKATITLISDEVPVSELKNPQVVEI